MSDDIGPQWARQESQEMMWRGPKGERGEPGQGLSAQLRRAIVVLFAIAAAVAVAAVIGVVVETGNLAREVHSQCRFDGDLAGVPISLNPATHKASQLSVKIVSDSRVAWHQAGCSGRLAPPSPSFSKWARYYRLPTG